MGLEITSLPIQAVGNITYVFNLISCGYKAIYLEKNKDKHLTHQQRDFNCECHGNNDCFLGKYCQNVLDICVMM